MTDDLTTADIPTLAALTQEWERAQINLQSCKSAVEIANDRFAAAKEREKKASAAMRAAIEALKPKRARKPKAPAAPAASEPAAAVAETGSVEAQPPAGEASDDSLDAPGFLDRRKVGGDRE